MGRRVQKTVAGAWTSYIYDLNGKAVSQAYSGGWGPGYVYLNGQLVALYGGANTTYFIHRDHLGSTRLATNLTQPVTQSNVAESLDYYPYGQLNNSTDPGLVPHEFTGFLLDPEINQDHAELRQYGLSQNRWLTPDPAGLAAVDPTNPQSWNRYAYVLNNPLSLADPTGTDPFAPCAGMTCEFSGISSPGGPCFMCGTDNMAYYNSMSDLQFYGQLYYQIPGNSGFGSNGAEEEARYVSIMMTAWDPELGIYEWNWHTLPTDLQLAVNNPACGNLVGTPEVATATAANIVFIPLQTAVSMIQATQPSTNTDGSRRKAERETTNIIEIWLSPIRKSKSYTSEGLAPKVG